LDYAELEVTSNFSFLRGASHPDELVYTAAELGYRAIALTDRNTLAGVVRAHAAAKSCGMKLIVGSRITLSDGPELLVWAPDRAAYARLCRLLTLGKKRVEKGEFMLSTEEFLQHSEGLEVAAAFAFPPPPLRGRAGVGGGARMSLGSVASIDFRTFTPPPDPLPQGEGEKVFLLREALGKRLSLAISRLFSGDDDSYFRCAVEVSRSTGIPLLATNAVYYHDPNRRPLQDVLVCIREGCTISEAGFKLFPNAERYLKSPEQMHRLFKEFPEAIRRGVEIAERCDFRLDTLQYEYPDELVPEGKTPLEFLAELSWQGAAQRYPDGIPDKVRDAIRYELKLIKELHYEAYFLTVYDLVKYARSRGILCQGRGSAANSAVCYCIGVTSVDPVKIDLLFERFVSRERNEPPDIDVDFEHERREEVIQYVYQKYGRDRAGMTATVITYRGRSAVRDVGKAMGLSLDQVDSIAKRLDWWHSGRLTDAQLREAGIDPTDPTVCAVVALTSELLGFPRHLGQHTGGMIMSRGPLCEMVPIENASMPDRTVVEWDKDDVEELGLLKVDVLALGMLTAISKAFGLLSNSLPPCGGGLGWGVGGEDETRDCAERSSSATPPPQPPTYREYAGTRQGGRGQMPSRLELHTVPSEDPIVYDMICNADTVGVFQIESRAQMSMLPRLRPRKFYDLVIEVAIVRPGPIQGNMVHPYLRRRNGEEPVTYPSEALQKVLEKTLGVPLFQEQAMKVAMVGAGFTAGEADQLRRAMAAWRRNGAIERFRSKIIDGMRRNGYTREFAEQTFQQIQGFGEYGFPESHSASFALLVYVSAWLKCYHPAVFCCAMLNSQPMGFYAPAQLVRDAKEHGVTVLPADVNESEWDCVLCPLPPCGGGPGWGVASDGLTRGSVTEFSIATPHTNPPPLGGRGQMQTRAVRLGFRQLKGFREQHARQIVEARNRCGRFSSVEQFQSETRLPARAIQKLAEADAFGSIKLSRRAALWETLPLQDDPAPLFNGTSSLRLSGSTSLPEMPLGQEVMIDYSTSGLSLKQHPLALVRSILKPQKIITAAEVQKMDAGRWVKVAGLVLIRQRPGTASGIVFETLEDETGVVNLIVRPDIFEKYHAAARHAGLLECHGYIERQGQVVHVMAKRLFDRSELIRGYELTSRDFH
jgi:error-prone DNA polymerase